MAIDIADVVAASGGEVVGKVRLQKIIYLLDKIGMNSSFSFSYHHYGPYSADIADGIDFEVFTGQIIEDEKNRKSDGVPYSIFKSAPSTENFGRDKLGELDFKAAGEFISVMDKYNSTELELAATAFWLVNDEQVEDWQSELRLRKGVKASNERIHKALNLLKEIGLEIKR